MLETTLEIAKFLIPSLIVFATAYYLLNSYLENQLKMRQVEAQLKKSEKVTGQVLPLRLQAYERLVLLLERLSTPNLIGRVRKENITIPEMQLAMIASIRTEFEHNYSQQIYISENAWAMVKSTIEEIISTINATASQLPTDAGPVDFSRALLHASLQGPGGLPNERAISFLKKEVQSIF